MYEYRGKIAPQLSVEDLFLVRNIIRAQNPGDMFLRFVKDGKRATEFPSGDIGNFGKINEKEFRTSMRLGLSNTIRAKERRVARIKNAIKRTGELQGNLSDNAKEVAKGVVAKLLEEIKLFVAIKDRI